MMMMMMTIDDNDDDDVDPVILFGMDGTPVYCAT